MISTMEETRIHLIAVVPPDSVERTLTDIKRSLFRTFSLVSGLALGPILPLGYRVEPPSAPQRDALPSMPPLATGGWTVAEDTLLLSVDPSDELSSLRAAVGFAPVAPGTTDAQPGGAHHGPIPLRTGLYVARLLEPSYPSRSSAGVSEREEEPPSANDILEFLRDPPRLRWRASEIACWALRYRDAERWWEAIVMEELWAVRLRKKDGGRL